MDRRPIGFERDSEYSNDGDEWGTYRFDDESLAFGPRDPEFDDAIAAMQAAADPTPVLPEPGMTPATESQDEVPVEGANGVSLSYNVPGLDSPLEQGATAGDAHRLAAGAEAAGSMQAGRDAGFAPTQRSGAEDQGMVQRQQNERDQADADLFEQQVMQQERQAFALQQEGEKEQARAIGQQKAAEAQMLEREAKIERLSKERDTVEEMDIERDWSVGRVFSGLATIVAATLQGAIGQHSALDMMERKIDRELKLKMKEKGSKLDRLADELGSEEQALSAAKAAAYKAVGRQVEAQGKVDAGQQTQANIPLLAAELNKKHQEQAHKFERKSMGNTIETFDQGQQAGFVPGDPSKVAAEQSLAQKDDLALRGADRADKALSMKERTANATKSLQPKSGSEAADYLNERMLSYAPNEGLSGQNKRGSWNKYSSAASTDRAQIEASQDAIDFIAKYESSGDVAGFGFWGGKVPTSMAGQEALDARKHVDIAKSLFIKAISGASVTESERVILEGIVQGDGSFHSLNKGLGIINKMSAARMAQLNQDNPHWAETADHLSGIGRQQNASSVLSQARAAAQSSTPKPAAAPSAAPAPTTAQDQERVRKITSSPYSGAF